MLLLVAILIIRWNQTIIPSKHSSQWHERGNVCAAMVTSCQLANDGHSPLSFQTASHPSGSSPKDGLRAYGTMGAISLVLLRRCLDQQTDTLGIMDGMPVLFLNLSRVPQMCVMSWSFSSTHVTHPCLPARPVLSVTTHL